MTKPFGLSLSLCLALAGGLLFGGCAPVPVPVLVDGLEQVRYTRCMLRADGETIHSSNYIGDGIVSGYPPGSKVEIRMFSPQRIDLSINGIPHQLHPSAGLFAQGDPNAVLERYFVNNLAELGLKETKCPEDEPAAGPTPEGEGPVGAAPGGQPPAGEQPAGEQPAGEQPAGEQPAGEQPAGEPAPAGEGAADKPAAPSAGWRLDLMKPNVSQAVKSGVAAIGMSKEQVYMAFGPPHFIGFDTVATPLSLDVIIKSNRWVYYSAWFPRTFTFGLAGKRAYVFDGTKLVQVD